MPIAEFSDAGRYCLTASNREGSATSSELVLVVTPLIARPGALDASFRPPLGHPFYSATTIQSDGRLLAVNATPATGTPPSSWVLRFNHDGAIDPEFNPESAFGISRGFILVADPADRLIVSIAPQPGALSGLVRLLPDGARDTTFSPPDSLRVRTPHGGIRSVIATGDELDVHGTFEGFSAEHTARLLRLGENGVPVPGFNAARVCLHGIEGQPMLRLPDGALLVPGGFIPDPECRGVGSSAHLIKFNADGALDPAFLSGDQPSYFPESLALQPDGKILLGGRFAGAGATFQPSLARLHPDGTLDRAFTPRINLPFPSSVDTDEEDEDDWREVPTVSSVVNAIALEPDGGMYIAGDFQNVDGIARPGFARLLSDGSLDLSFIPDAVSIRPPSDLRPQIRRIHRRADGDLLISGWFTHIASAQRLGIARVFGVGTGRAIELADAALERAVRAALNKTSGAITTRDLATLTALDMFGRGVTSLTGLEHAVNLGGIVLDRNAVSDLSPLAFMSALTTVSLLENSHANLEPLRQLQHLRHLCLDAALAVGGNVEVIAALQARGVEVSAFPSVSLRQPVRCELFRYARCTHLQPRDGAYAPTVEWGLALAWPCLPGMIYHVEKSPDLQTWEGVELGPLSSSETTLTVPLPPEESGRGFYRVRSNR